MLRIIALLVKVCGIAGILICSGVIAAAQAGSPTVTPPPPQGEDSDPTRPVVWSLREEYYNLRGQAWNNAFIFRIDRAFLGNRPRVFGRRGLLTRLDVPLIAAGRPDGTSGGLGDIYAQALAVVTRSPQFAFVAGSGIVLPTATNRTLGTGKLTLAPAVAPVWFFPKRGFFFVKVQDYFSVAGAHDRPDLHYMLITPLLVWRLKDTPYWIQLDGESQTNWRADGQTSYKSGFLFGRMNKRRMGFWIKVEVGIGHDRLNAFTIKTGLFRVR